MSLPRVHLFAPLLQSSPPLHQPTEIQAEVVVLRRKSIDGKCANYKLSQQKGSPHLLVANLCPELTACSGSSFLSVLCSLFWTQMGAFKTPSLREVELTGPYMHNGSIKTLLDVIRLYNRGGANNATLSEKIRPLHLNEREMSDIVEFLRALTSDNVLRQAQFSKPQTRERIPFQATKAKLPSEARVLRGLVSAKADPISIVKPRRHKLRSMTNR